MASAIVSPLVSLATTVENGQSHQPGDGVVCHLSHMDGLSHRPVPHPLLGSDPAATPT